MRTDNAVRTKHRLPGGRRSRLLEKSQARRHRLYNLWYQYSPKLDQDVVLSSDAAFDHFCWLEGDPNVRTYVLDPDPLSLCIDDQSVSARFDVRVDVRSGRPQLRDVNSRGDAESEVSDTIHKHRWADQAGFDYLPVGLSMLRQHHQLIANWRRAIAFIAAARDWPLDEFQNDLALATRYEPDTTIAGLLLNIHVDSQPLLLAALFRALQEGWLDSNLDQAPLSPSTRIRRVEENVCAVN